YEAEVCALMNQYFDLLLIHADPRLQRLEETFGSADGINCAIYYTGYVRQAEQIVGQTLVRPGNYQTNVRPTILVSVGSGRVGSELIDCALDADTRLAGPRRLHILTGPHMPVEEFQSLRRRAEGQSYITVESHTTQFLTLLRQADLSISMAGYNTCMD